MIRMNDWYKKMFEGKFGEFWLKQIERWEETSELQASFLREILEKGLTLDHCCGPGRISVLLADSMPIVGLDLSRFFLKAAKKRAKQAGRGNLYLIRADMRYLPFKHGAFDNVINLWTSFGYFSDEENRRVIREVSRVLRNGGNFLLDTFNPGWMIRSFRDRDWNENEQYLMLEERSVKWKDKKLKTRWIIVNKRNGEIGEITTNLRLYDLEELKELLREEKLETVKVYGSFKKEKEEFKEARSNRIIIVSQKQ